MASIFGQNRIAIASIDVEPDWGGRLPAQPEYLRGVRMGIPAIFEILQKYEIPATLFVNGESVPHISEALNLAVSAGYEIASHGFTHRRMPELSREEIREELSKSKAVLETATGQTVSGFRAPQARITDGLFAELKRAGYEYDSSVFGGKMPTRFDNREVSQLPHMREGIWEIPVNQLPLIPLPMGLLWVDLFNLSSIQLLTQFSPLPSLVHLYMHPFDFIPAYPVEGFAIPRGAKLWYTRRRGSALRTLEKAIAWLRLSGYSFVTAGELVKLEKSGETPLVNTPV
ncbi:polysaccharide deacetylase family protein [Lyngbya sp. CCY1209]|uniref:polysaccharide deacetylase family protein n=1 Tax=Lyngbya sp. CCY1209 TaxID=2886103 RepID=UPI002D21255E|nr:polysaccharide deacetylase family protein [Lyngbya sp. CCY1209]MEB3885966.1 polysaccharide deacetylase family protein [Lyngbya sp. CCY1209]